MCLINKKVFVTGGAVRIGAEIVRAFSNEGAKIAFSYKDSSNSARKLLKEIGGKKRGHDIFKFDLEDKIPNDIFAKIGGADILINNASLYHHINIALETTTSIRKQLEVNFIAPLLLSQLFAKQKIKSGCIINLLDCRIADLNSAHGSYWLSKKSLQNATEMLAIQLAPQIRVNAVAPGAILPPAKGNGFSAKIATEASPLKRLPSMENLIEAILFLAKNNSVSGQTIFVDSGRHLL